MKQRQSVLKRTRSKNKSFYVNPVSKLLQMGLVKSGLIPADVRKAEAGASALIPRKPMDWYQLKEHLKLIRKHQVLVKVELHVSKKQNGVLLVIICVTGVRECVHLLA